MKRLFYMLLLAIVVSSCKSKTEQATTDTIVIAATNNAEAQKLIAEFKPIIQGVWVKKDYIDEVVKSKSPLAASYKAVSITTMHINTENIKGDSLIVGAGWGNHEGSDMILKFKPGKRPRTILYGESDLGFEIAKGDTILVWYKKDEEKNTTEVIRYKKALLDQPNDNLGHGMDVLINKGIIAGKYDLIDNTANREVVFTTEGRIIGFPNTDTYHISNDLNGEPLNNLDRIAFDLYTKHQTSYTFKFNADTLNLYDTKPDTDSMLLVVDKLRYKLVRKK